MGERVQPTEQPRDPRLTVLTDYHGWVHKVTNSICGPSQWEDVAQEGKIALWRAASTWDSARGAFPSYVTMIAKQRMLRVAHGTRGLTGEPPRRGKWRRPEEPVDLLGGAAEAWEDQFPRAAGPGSASDLTYHHREIHDAIRSLDPRDQTYVFDRFWLDTPLGHHPLRYRWGPIREKLASQLSHLRGGG